MPFTIFDSRVDRISINPRKQAYEKVCLLFPIFRFSTLKGLNISFSFKTDDLRNV